MRKRLLTGLLVVALLLVVVIPGGIVFANSTQEVAITIRAEFVSMTNSETDFVIGIVEANDPAVKWGGSDTHSTATNTGSVAIDIQLQGEDLVGEALMDWVLGVAAGDQIYQLYANSDHSTNYNIEIQNAVYTNLTTALGAGNTWTWSMEFTCPTIFDPDDAGESKLATLTLVASKT